MRPCLRLPPSAFLALVLAAPAFGGAPARTDALGDPLPDGALMRLGTSRFRVPPVDLPVRLSPDGKLIAVGDRGDGVHLLDAADGSEIRRIKAGRLGMTPIGFSPAGDLLATSTNGDTISLWDMATGKPRGGIEFKLLQRDYFTFSADGRTGVAVTGSWSEKAALHVFAVPDGKEIGSFDSVHNLVSEVAFSANGKWLACRGESVVVGGISRAVDPKLSQVVQVYDLTAAKELKRVETDCGAVSAVAFSPDGRVLATGCEDTTILLWDAAGAPTAEPELKTELKADALDALWADLASAGAESAGRAIARLAAAPKDAVPYLKKRVQPLEGKSAAPAVIDKLVKDLNADDFDIREKAERELGNLGPAAAPALRKATEGAPAPELRRRAEGLLVRLTRPDLSAETLRLRRAVEALERAGTPEARDWLAELAKGRAEADVTEDARAALKRLGNRPADAP